MKRSDRDESTLQAMLPSLQVLSTNAQNQSRYSREIDSDSPSLAVELAELAEMSSHAMALIVARKCWHSGDETNDDETSLSSRSGLELIAERICMAESDLQSSQPPLRAKVVVSLRHIARSLTTDSTVSGVCVEKKPALVIEVGSAIREGPDQTALIASSLARICFISLADTESYVYLASIQTLVVISDVCPSEILPLTAALVADGTMNMTILTSGAKATSVALSLNPEQRIKAAEALIFMIRRRGDGIFRYSQLLLDFMIFGSRQSHLSPHDNTNLSNDVSLEIQAQTHSYFIGSDDDTRNKDYELEEREVRVNTGGPVFKLEEDDLLRGTSISVVCELIAVMKPVTVAPYCRILVNLVIDALQLDKSRPVRRAAASLARELYSSVETEISGNDDVSSTASMAVALVCSRETVLCAVLRSCLTGNATNTSSKAYFTDVATQSRCMEAIEIRKHLESLSVFNAAALVAESMKVESEPVAVAIKKALSK
jgi:hypothetical protein